MTGVVIRNPAAVEEALSWGPAMQRLSPMRQQFVLELLKDPANEGKRAAIAAGYGNDGRSAVVIASRLRHDPTVLAAIHECAVAQLSSLKLLATQTIRDILENPTTRAADRIKAAALVLDRTGIPAQTDQHIVVEDKRQTAAERVADIIMLARQLGQDPRVLLGNIGIIIEAEFVEVPPAETTAGLEDLIGDGT
jgi:phage terminase small subunit